MRESFPAALARVLAHEGGYVNHPKDPGGATNRGVTQRVYDAYRARLGEPARTVRAITAEEVADIYERQYWDAVKADHLPVGLDYAVFDYAVNSGPGRAVKDLQRELGVAVDGVIGQMTLAAVARADIYDLIERLCARRMRFLRSLKHWGTFGRGWTRRVQGEFEGAQPGDVGVLDVAVRMIAGEAVSAPSAPAPGKAEERPRASVVQSQTVQASAVDVLAKAGAGLAAVTAIDDRWVQLAVIGLVAIGLVASAVIFRRRLEAWAEGVR